MLFSPSINRNKLLCSRLCTSLQDLKTNLGIDFGFNIEPETKRMTVKFIVFQLQKILIKNRIAEAMNVISNSKNFKIAPAGNKIIAIFCEEENGSFN